jgi:Uma2 family endonuclease
MADLEALGEEARPELIDGVLYYWELRPPTRRMPSRKAPSRKSGAGLVLRGRPGTLADLATLGEDARPELIDGVLYQFAATPSVHKHIIDRIVMSVRKVYDLGKRGPGGWWIEPEFAFRTSGSDVLRPDVLGWKKERLTRVPVPGRVRKSPDWVCEIVSPTTLAHDLGVKREAYARAGVRYRWYINPETRVLQTFELKRGQWIETRVFCDDDVVRAEPFASVAIPMATWWASLPPTVTTTRRMPSRAGKLS